MSGSDARDLHLTRRSLLRSAGAMTVAGAAGAVLEDGPAQAKPSGGGGGTLSFYGPHQQGIATAQQSALCLASFDLELASAPELRSLMHAWSSAAARMTQGLPAVPGTDATTRPPLDSGETAGLLAGRLTVTFGFGQSVFSLPGLGRARPARLKALPRFRTDHLDVTRSGGDLVVQACADDPTIAFHAIRMLHLIAAGAVRLRWTQTGFLPARYRGEHTPRNLMGMKDGTLNPRPGQRGFDQIVWVDPGDDPSWLRGGTYMVFRRIRMNLRRWDSASVREQERTIGRRRDTGAPLSSRHEHDAPNFTARDQSGGLVIPHHAHIRVAHRDFNGGIEILRRGYSYDAGVTELAPLSDKAPPSDARGFDAGLAFIAFMRDPQQFIRLQTHLARQDTLNEYITHVGSGLFVIPPGASAGGFVGDTLLG